LSRNIFAGGLFSFKNCTQEQNLNLEEICEIMEIRNKDLPLFAFHFNNYNHSIRSIIVGINSESSLNSTLSFLEKEFDFERLEKIKEYHWKYE